MQPLTPRQSEVYAYLKDFLVEHHRQPTYREIGAGLGMESTGAICHLRALHRKGWIALEPHKSQVRWRLTGVRLCLVEGGAAADYGRNFVCHECHDAGVSELLAEVAALREALSRAERRAV